MPKRVDHEERRRQIAEALWRVASTRGIDKVGLREIAAEAGMSLGQLQHYFSGKDALLVFALEHIGQLASRRIQDRIAQAYPDTPPTPRQVLDQCVRGMLPLDEKSRTGVMVQAAYFTRAIRDARLRAVAQQGIPSLRELFATMLRQGIARGEVDATRDPDAEAMLLIAMIDGLNSYVLLEVQTAEQALALADHHLDRLFSGRG